MQASSRAWEGTEPQARTETLSPLSRQAMSVALAYRGGLGIARMLVEKLPPASSGASRAGLGEKIRKASSG